MRRALREYHVSAVTGGRDALARSMSCSSWTASSSGVGVSTDILEASGKAYLRAISNALANDVAGEAERVLEREAKKTRPHRTQRTSNTAESGALAGVLHHARR